MPTRHQRSRTIKRKTLRLPGGRSAIHYRKKIGRVSACSSCGAPLHGTPSTYVRRNPKSSRRPSRPFGGTLCHSCLRELVRQGIRVG